MRRHSREVDVRLGVPVSFLLLLSSPAVASTHFLISNTFPFPLVSLSPSLSLPPSLSLSQLSLGAAIAAGLASEVLLEGSSAGPVPGLLLDAPFVNSTMAALHHSTTLPIRLLVPFADWIIRNALIDLYDTDDLLSEVDVPVLILQGNADAEIPMLTAGGAALETAVKEGRRRRGRRESGVELVEYEGAGHENVNEQEGYGEVVVRFMREAKEVAADGEGRSE